MSVMAREYGPALREDGPPRRHQGAGTGATRAGNEAYRALRYLTPPFRDRDPMARGRRAARMASRPNRDRKPTSGGTDHEPPAGDVPPGQAADRGRPATGRARST